MPNWRRTESRVVRPFVNVEEALRNVRFKIQGNAEFDDRTSFDASDTDRCEIHPQFLFDIQAPVSDMIRPLTTADIHLVIRLSDARLRRSELVFERSIEDLPRTWTVAPEVKDRFSWKFGLTASVALVLREDRPPRPGLPFMRGHWIARKDFSVSSKPERRMFPIERWTAEDFARYRLPRDTVYWINFIRDDINERFNDPGEAFRICLRDDVYDALLDAEESPAGRAVMKLIEAEILTEVLWRGLNNLEPYDDIEKGGLLYAALSRVKKVTGANEEELSHVVTIKKELSTLRAFVQAAIYTRKDLVRLR